MQSLILTKSTKRSYGYMFFYLLMDNVFISQNMRTKNSP